MIDFEKNCILLDDSLTGNSMYFENPEIELTAFNNSEFIKALKKIDKYKKTKYVIGYITYESYKIFQNVEYSSNTPLLYFAVYDKPTYINLDNEFHEPYTNLEKNITQNDYNSSIKTIKKEIKEGNTYQVNFTYSNTYKAHCSNENLYKFLRNKQKTSYSSFIKNDYQTIMSFSPELFFEINDNIITTKPMKGTVKRGLSNAEDIKLKKFLQSDEKNRAENLMIVDLLRNDLGKICKNVEVKSLFNIETYESVHQMTSTISANLKNNSTYDILEALFPCGSITGAPKINTMKIIDTTEEGERGVYCGAIGYFSPKKTVFSVPIRTLESKSNFSWKYQVGGGIVWDSKENDEWEETILKTSFLNTNISFKLVETILIKDKKPSYLNEHITRLEKAANFFGYKLKNLPKFKEKDGILRLILDKNGDFEVQHKELKNLPNKIAISSQNIDSKNIFLKYKTTYRPWYDVDIDNLFDVIFFNEKGELTEGTRSNIFIKKDDKFYTPKLSSGLLNGILRQKMLDNNQCEEKILYKEDLIFADEIYCGNSVRGLQKVHL